MGAINMNETVTRTNEDARGRVRGTGETTVEDSELNEGRTGEGDVGQGRKSRYRYLLK